MKLEVLGSGSKGNCYILHNDEEALVIEAGVPFAKVSQALKGKTDKIVGCLITHEHKDHSGKVREFLDHAVRVYATQGTIEAMEPWAGSSIGRPMKFMSRVLKLGNFLIIPFDTVHDAEEPCGFYINHKEIGNLLFATDTNYIPNRFKDLSNIMIEANFSDDLLDARTDIPESLKERIRDSHMSIDTCVEALKANNLALVNKIILIHISDGDGDKEEFKERVISETCIPCEVAEAGKTFEIGKLPF